MKKIILSAVALTLAISFSVNAEEVTNEENEQTAQQTVAATNSVHKQDLRYRGTNVEAGYNMYSTDNNGNTDVTATSVGADIGLMDDRLSVGLEYTNIETSWDALLGEDSHNTDVVTIDTQFNLNKNIVLGGSYAFTDGDDILKINADYVKEAGFGVWDAGAYVLDGDIGLSAGALIPLGSTFYYRADLDLVDFDHLAIANRIGATLGAFDLGLEYVYQDNTESNIAFTAAMHF